MARKKKSAKKPIEQYDHKGKKRINNPPVGLVTPETDKETAKKTYAYDPHIGPSLQWAGKAEYTSFEVPTVSLHVHERIDPCTIIESVRKSNDQKQVQLSLLEKEGLAGKVQMIYIDPPYGIKYGSNFQPFVNKRDVKDGKDEDLTAEAVPAPMVKPLDDISFYSDQQIPADESIARSGETLRHAQWRDELLRTGIRGKHGQFILFSRVEPIPATRWLHAEAETKPNDRGADSVRENQETFGQPVRAVISFGPEHAPLEQRQVGLAIEEAQLLVPKQVFFPMSGKKDGWSRLAKNLKADIDPDLIEAYRGTVSLPFEIGDNRRIAVKIVDDRGIESLKIMEID